MIYTVGMAIDTDITPGCTEDSYEEEQDRAVDAHRRETASAGCQVDAVGHRKWEVASPSGKTYFVRVRTDGKLICECPAGLYRRAQAEPCKHVAAVAVALASPDRLRENIRADLLAEEPDIAHALVLVDALARLAPPKAASPAPATAPEPPMWL